MLPLNRERPAPAPLRSFDTHPLVRPNDPHDTYESKPPDFSDPAFTHPRESPMSSSRFSSSPSPPPSRHPPHPPAPPPKLKLIPTSELDSADAVLLVTPPSGGKESSQPLLLVGDALRHVRSRERQIAKGVRLHPYKIVREEGGRSVLRRTSMDSRAGSSR
ncbi:hypothetical protein OE88DRAFT_1739131 [Heliocybe sulcata]|uniref:Uncharacterized protein n=1 Tax=Heliocybe sulcata TaxID=5364 RepID=A0A5C3MND2_9AGAM|nr:hypothetical protein OE88DRAFT_1739131 [Heliocybe sulcata]